MDPEEYLEVRVKDQIEWYDKKTSWNKSRFMVLKVTGTILALLVPLFVAYTEGNILFKIIVGALGVLVAAITNLITLFKFQENWIEYRTVAESLKHEKFLFLTNAGPYKEAASFPVFVERFESYISKENSQWASYIIPKQSNK